MRPWVIRFLSLCMRVRACIWCCGQPHTALYSWCHCTCIIIIILRSLQPSATRLIILDDWPDLKSIAPAFCCTPCESIVPATSNPVYNRWMLTPWKNDLTTEPNKVKCTNLFSKDNNDMSNFFSLFWIKDISGYVRVHCFHFKCNLRNHELYIYKRIYTIVLIIQAFVSNPKKSLHWKYTLLAEITYCTQRVGFSSMRRQCITRTPHACTDWYTIAVKLAACATDTLAVGFLERTSDMRRKPGRVHNLQPRQNGNMQSAFTTIWLNKNQDVTNLYSEIPYSASARKLLKMTKFHDSGFVCISSPSTCVQYLSWAYEMNIKKPCGL